jgi:hypothetical protein
MRYLRNKAINSVYEIATLVDTMLQLNKQLQEATLPHHIEQLKQGIAFTHKKLLPLFMSCVD